MVKSNEPPLSSTPAMLETDVPGSVPPHERHPCSLFSEGEIIFQSDFQRAWLTSVSRGGLPRGGNFLVSSKKSALFHPPTGGAKTPRDETTAHLGPSRFGRIFENQGDRSAHRSTVCEGRVRRSVISVQRTFHVPSEEPSIKALIFSKLNGENRDEISYGHWPC
jgi:hypothetical protein